MAQQQLERTRRSFESPKSPTAHQISPTFEQILRAEEAQCSPSRMSPTLVINHDQDEYLSLGNNNRKSVLTKVKERAKKLRYSLSGKRRQENEMSDGNSIHPRGSLSLDNNIQDMDNDGDTDDELDGDPEYLGAPMYESIAAPENLKETARQHPRAVPVVSENHQTLKCLNCKQETDSPNTTTTESMSEKLAQPLSTVSDATYNIASRIAAGLALTTPGPDEEQKKGKIQSGTRGQASNAVLPGGDDSSRYVNQKHGPGCSPQAWDKGVSMREYFMNKLEPGEDERVLSHAITDAMSPRRSSAADDGMRVVDKVRGAVASIFWHQEQSDIMLNTAGASSSTNIPNYSPRNHTTLANAHPSEINCSPSRPSPLIVSTTSPKDVPRLTHKDAVVEEENQGKILQAN